LSTSADVVPDPRRRLALVEAWTELPDLVTANQGEGGIVELCELLVTRGIGIEAGLLSLDDAQRFVATGIASRCIRAMVEPLDADPDTAVEHAAAIEQLLADAGVSPEQVHHGDGIASWAVNLRAIPRGHGIRTGLEDTPVLPDGRTAEGNSDLVAAAASMLGRHEDLSKQRRLSSRSASRILNHRHVSVRPVRDRRAQSVVATPLPI